MMSITKEFPTYTIQQIENDNNYYLDIKNGVKIPLFNGNLSSVVWHVTPEFHRHDFWEICFVIRGSSIQHFLDRAEEMHVGSVYLLRPDDVHYISPMQNPTPVDAKSSNYIHRDIYIPKDKMKKICDVFDANFYEKLISLSHPLSSVLSKSEIELFESLLNLSPTNDFSLLHTTVTTHVLCCLLEKNSYQKHFVPKWITDLLINLDREDFLTQDICQIVQSTGYNQSYVCRQFKKFNNETLVAYIHKRKCNYSLQLLSNPDIPIAYIAHRLCFSDESAYIRIFKSIYSVTPGHWRKNNLKLQ